jgi:solute carrier family 35 (UDP-sugar transporter), member A1/2/3
MGRINFNDLFPTKGAAVIFVLYMTLFVAQGIFVTASQKADSSYSYNVVTVVLFTEVLKLVASVGLYLRG